MGKTLVIVESPAKAKTISKFLGKNYTVKASMGHVRDLPRSQFGVDVENGFQPKYITVRGQGKVLQELRAAAKKCDRVLLATDPDREGEAISWHLAQALDLEPGPNRIEFHEITKPAIQRAIQNPRELDTRLIDAQQARRVLDRIVGYKLSPLLWAKVKRGLSAGRVQSVALRLICDREAEIAAFEPEEYWSITAKLKKVDGQEFEAKLHLRGGEKVDITSRDEAEEILRALGGARYVVRSVTRRERRRRPAAPFTTSTMQQEASRKLGFTARKTMSLAQDLYEGMDVGPEGTVGLITYLRTDSTEVAAEAQAEARAFIEERFGAEYRPARPPRYASRKGAQAAHEAIRPTSVLRTPESLKPYLKRDHLRLYKLIWERFVASQMAPAVLDTVSCDIEAGEFVFRATGSQVKFPGFMTLYIEKSDDDQQEEHDDMLPDLSEGEELSCTDLEPKQHFTQPPPRYTEAMLVKTLEELGIGRPSTYVSIIDTIQRRGYVVREDKRFVPTELGQIIVELLTEYFPKVVDVEFTATMEAKLDEIEEGKENWTDVIREFYGPFEEAVQNAHKDIEEIEIEDEVTEEVCEVCGRNMVIKWGRYGQFLACPGFPECRNTKPLLKPIGVACPKCGKDIVERRSRKGRVFYGCSGYPDCDFTSWQKPVPAKCPVCDAMLVERNRRGRGAEWVCPTKGCGYVQEPTEAGEVAIATAHEERQ